MGNELTLAPAGPRCPSEPFVDSRETEEEVAEAHQSRIPNHPGKGDSVHTDAYSGFCSRKHLQIAEMRQTHSEARGSRHPSFAFLTFGAMLSWVTIVALRITMT